MNNFSFSILALTLIHLSSSFSSWAMTDSERAQFAQKMAPDQLMCSQGVCVTEEDLYLERGPMIYAIEDQLYYQKYEMAKSLILQKIIEKKLAGTGQTFADYNKKLSQEIKTSDEEVIKFLKDLKITDVDKGSIQFLELKEKLNSDKIMGHYRKIFNDYKGKKGIVANIPMRPRQSIKPQFENWVSYQTMKNEDLKITMLINPTRTDQLTYLDSVEIVSKHMNTLGKKISWYFLPFTDGKSDQTTEKKFFLCSIKLDKGKSFRDLKNLDKKLELNESTTKILKKLKHKVEPIQLCMNSKETISRINKMNEFLKDAKLPTIPQIFYNDEVEYRIPTMIELKNRVDLKLKIQALVKSPSTKA